MPKLSCTMGDARLVPGQSAITYATLAFDGLIDAANYAAFESALERATRDRSEAIDLILDFARVHYINSTGISAIIRAAESCRERDRFVCLAGVSREVGLSMHLLGLTALVPFARDVARAEEWLAKAHGDEESRPPLAAARGGSARGDGTGGSGNGSDGAGNGGASGAATTGRAAFQEMRTARRAKPGRVLVITPGESRVTRVLRRRFEEVKRDTYHLLHDAGDALRSFDEIRPDLVVLDDRCDPSGEFVSRLKVQKERSLTSVIKTYGKATDVRGSIDFKIWENDYLVDPFDVLHFFSLTEAELDRVPEDRRVFRQQVHFEFRSSPHNVEKAHKLSELIVRSALSREDDVTTFFAAVKEGLDNAVRHGNGSSAERRVDVNFLVDQHKVTVIVEDEGEGFDSEYYLARVRGKDAFEEAKRRIVDEGVRGGLGILLMARCSDRIEYAGPGNVLRLEKNVESRAG